MIELLLKRAAAVLKAFDTEGGKYLRFVMQTWLTDLQRKLRRESNSVEIYRLQGRIEVLERIIGLREEIVENQRKHRTTE